MQAGEWRGFEQQQSQVLVSSELYDDDDRSNQRRQIGNEPLSGYAGGVFYLKRAVMMERLRYAVKGRGGEGLTLASNLGWRNVFTGCMNCDFGR